MAEEEEAGAEVAGTEVTGKCNSTTTLPLR